MTVSSSTARADYNGNGSTTAFTVPFYFLNTSHLLVLSTVIATGVSTTLVLGTDYTVTGAGVPAGGTVTATVAPITGVKLSILRNVPITQTYHYVPNDPFPAASHENALDLLTMEVQQVNEVVSRAVKLPAGTAASSSTLPQPSTNSLIGWDSTASALINYGAVDNTTLALQLGVPTGSSLVGHIASGVGVVARTLQDKGRDWLSRLDYSTLAQMNSADIYKPKIDTTTGKAWFNTDPTPLDYVTTSRAGYVWQHKDTASGTTNEIIPGAVFQFNNSGNGVVNSGAESSSTIWTGLYAYCGKSGDGSAHSFTCTGELKAFGAGGYNELGGFEGTLTNIGSNLGTMSGVEMLLQDSPNAGTTSFNTKMQAIVGRIAQFNGTTRKSYNFYASSEGSVAPAGCFGVNPSGLHSWQRGIDFQGATFTLGQAMLSPNNTSLAWFKADAVSAVPIFGVNNLNQTYIYTPDAAGATLLLDSAGLAQLSVAGSGNGVWFRRRFTTIVAATYTVAVADTHLLFFTTAACVVSLPSAATNNGKEITLRTIAAFAITSDTANVSPMAGGAATTSILPATAGKWVTLVSDGTSWHIQQGN